MLNNSKRLLNSSSGELYKEENKSNGKAKCFVCKKDQYEEPLDNDDFFCFNKKKTKQLSTKVKGNNNVIIITGKSSLINPCKCETRVAHNSCLVRYVMLNLTFKCNNCNAYFNVDYENRTSNCFKYLKNTILILTLLILHGGIYALAILLLINELSFIDLYYFWQIIIAAGLILFNSFLIYFSFRCVYCQLKYQQYNLKVLSFSNINGAEKLTNKEITEFSKFLENKYCCNKLELMERRLSIIYRENYIKNKIKLSKFIKENNNFYYINKSEANSKRSLQVLPNSFMKKDNIENISMRHMANSSNSKLLMKQKTNPKSIPRLSEDNNIVLVKQKTENKDSEIPFNDSVLKKADEEGEKLLLNTIQENDSEILNDTNNLKLSTSKAMPVEKIIQLQVSKKNRRISSKIDTFTNQNMAAMTNSYVNCDSIVEDDKQ
jgi:hypothetical protein